MAWKLVESVVKEPGSVEIENTSSNSRHKGSFFVGV